MTFQCLKFKTYSSIFLNRFEALNLSLMRKMQNKQHPQPVADAPIDVSDSGGVKETAAAAAIAAGTTGVAGGGGVKKKKPKKKK